MTELVHIRIGDVCIDATTNHPIWVDGYGFIPADELRVGDIVEIASGEKKQITSVETECYDEPVTVYNFEVMDWHTYYVSELEVLVHNADCSKAESGSTNLSGKWVETNEYMSDFSRAYQKQITGREGEVWYQNGVKYDGMKDGVLLDAKGKYAQFVDKNTGKFYTWFKGRDSLVSEARRQIAASEGTPIKWYFAEESAMEATQSLFMEQGITGIELIFEAFY